MTVSELSSLISAVAALVLAIREIIRAILALLPRKWLRHHTGP